jgi:hypothetical protein
MADFGIGETIALSAALGAGTAAMKNQDPLRGALIGGVLGGATAGIGSAFGGAGAAAAGTAESVTADALTAPAIQGVEAANIANPELTNSFANQAMDASRGMVEPSAEEGIKQLSQNAANAASGSNIPYDPMQASQEGFKYTGPQGIQTSANTTQFNPPPKGFFDQSTKTWLGDAPLNSFTRMAAPAVATTLTPMFNKNETKYGIPAVEHYNGPLSQLHYDPNKYTPTIPTPPNPPYQPSYAGYAGYAQGGITQLKPQTNFAAGGSAPLFGTPAANTTMDSTIGNNTMFPMSEMGRSYYATPTQMPAGVTNNRAPESPQSIAGTTGGYEAKVTPYDGTMSNNFAGGGIAGLLKGQGDGMSDDIHATIGGSQPARLADGEFVIPADVVSHLGNGSTDAGAKHLYAMMDKVRKARTGRKAQGKQIKAGGYLPA